jgi:hypothetical protein
LSEIKDTPVLKKNVEECPLDCMNACCLHGDGQECLNKCGCSKNTCLKEAKVGFGPGDAENLIAGIIEGLIGKNDLPEIKKCLNDSSSIE